MLRGETATPGGQAALQQVCGGVGGALLVGKSDPNVDTGYVFVHVRARVCV